MQAYIISFSVVVSHMTWQYVENVDKKMTITEYNPVYNNHFLSNLFNVIPYWFFKEYSLCLMQSSRLMIFEENFVQFRELECHWLTRLIWLICPGSGRHAGRITSVILASPVKLGCLILLASCIMATSYIMFLLSAVYEANFGWISIRLILIHCDIHPSWHYSDIALTTREMQQT